MKRPYPMASTKQLINSCQFLPKPWAGNWIAIPVRLTLNADCLYP